MTLKVLYIVPYGLEKVSNSQIKGTIVAKSLILKDYDHLHNVINDVFKLRVYYRALLYIAHFSTTSITDIEGNLHEIGWAEWLPYGSFACRCSRRGKHDFRSIDVERLCGSVILQKTKNLHVNLTKPDSIVRIIVENDDVYVGLDLTGYDSMHKRGYRVYQHPSALNPVLAYHLVLLAGEFNSLLDPTCGGGTILIEACHHKFSIPAGSFRRQSLAMCNLPFLINKIDVNAIIRSFEVKTPDCNSPCFIGIDNSPKVIDGASQNIKKALCDKCTSLIKKDIVMEKLNFNNKFDVIITNPPYGIRLGSPRKALKVHEAVVMFAHKYLHPGGKLVIITPHLTKVESYFGYTPIDRYTTFSGDLPVEIGVFLIR